MCVRQLRPRLYATPPPHALHAANFALAGQIYDRGIARGAAPVDRLHARRREFQRRAYRAWVTVLKERDAGERGFHVFRADVYREGE